MTMPKTEHFPNDPDRLPPARRRRARRLLAPLNADERAAHLDNLAHRTSPTFDFFLFSLVAGALFGIGLLLDSPAVLVFGALVAPLMAPATGISLGTVIGSLRFFFRSLAGLLIGSLMAFLAGAAAGAVSGFTPLAWQYDLTQVHLHAQLSWPDFLVLVLGAGLTAAAMLNPKRNPALPSVALAYELYLPLVIAGFGLVSGEPHLWPDGLVIFAVHLAWSALIGAITLAVLGFRPLTLFGYTLGGVVTILGVIALIGISGTGAAIGGQIALPTPVTPSPTTTLTITPTPTRTATPVPPTATPTPTFTLTPTSTPTETITPSPTPMYALVAAEDDRGAVLRAEPGGTILQSYFNGTLMQVFPDTMELDGLIWVRVAAPDGLEGWMVQTLLATATPAPNW